MDDCTAKKKVTGASMNFIRRKALLFILLTLFIGCCLEPASHGLVINEFMASNGSTISDADGDFEDWIELYNATDSTRDLTGCFLSDDDDEPLMWQFPGGTIEPDGFLLVWASGKDKQDADGRFHTNFRISLDGEPLLLSDAQGNLLDRIGPALVPRDISFGRQPDGAENWYYFDVPTPGASNTTTGHFGVLAPPEFSHPAGRYAEGIDLAITHSDVDADIYYTLDGGTPTEHSNRYEAPLRIDRRHQEPAVFSHIPVGYSWLEPEGEVFTIAVLRAVARREGFLDSPTSNATFLVDEDIHQRYHVPIISLVTDADNFFAPDIGIYVPGNLYQNLYPDRPWRNPGNFSQRGLEWERPVHLSFFTPDGVLSMSQDAGVRIHGGLTRAWQPKSLRFYARGGYGAAQFEAPLFEHHYTKTFRRFLLRNSGNDFESSYLRDGVMQDMVSELGLDQQAYRPGVLFINGEYWGIHNIRERLDAHYLHLRHGVDPDNLDILTGNRVVKAGSAGHYNAMMQFLGTHDMHLPENYRHMKTLMDTDNFITYQCVQIYIGNNDWPQNNIDFWRLRNDVYNPDAPYGHDGRWRWMLFDIDRGFELYAHHTTRRHNTLAHATRAHWSTSLFTTLLENTEFRNTFINRMADMMNSVFHPDTVTKRILDAEAHLEPLMGEHIKRWGRPRSMSAWQNDIQVMLGFAVERPQYMYQHILAHFNLPGLANISLNEISGCPSSVRINTVTVDTFENGWHGTYFQGLPIEIEALPAPGFAFAGWEGLPAGFPALVEVELTDDLTLTAYFERNDDPALLHYWNFNEDSTAPSYTVGGASLTAVSGDETEFTYANGQGFFGENARFDDETVSHLRVNDPLGASLTFHVPTTGFEDIVFLYETRRSGQGAGIQEVYYTLDGIVYEPFGTFEVYDDVPVLHELDFFRIEGTNNNPAFAVRIEFEQGAVGTAGNNRFDNVTVDSVPGGVNRPPVAEAVPGLLRGVEQGEEVVVLLGDVFSDPDDDALTYEVVVAKPDIAEAEFLEDTLVLSPQSRGGVEITVLADDGHNDPVSASFHLLVYPKAHRVADGPFTFDAWSPDAPDGAFPEHMLFLQTDVTDPGVNAPLDYAYHIPHDDYNEDDLNTVGYPYNNTRRTRINGLGEDGISFINTGRDRDLGGALLALDTTDSASDVLLGWLSGTVLQNERRYAIRPQYRIGYEGPFLNLPGDTWEYLVGEDGDVNDFGPLLLPESLLEEPYVQLLWRYYHVAGDSGPRAALRLDDIVISATEPIEGEIVPVEGEAVMEGELAGEGEAPVVEGETEGESEGEGEGEGEGDGEVDGEGEIEGEIEGEDELLDEESRCGIVERCGCGDSGYKRLQDRLGDWLLVGLAAMLLLVIGKMYG